MTFSSLPVTARHDLSPDEIDDLENRLYAFNAASVGRDDAALLGFVAEEGGALAGAVAGYTWAGVCDLRQVWVREDQRGRGLGEQLMRRAIDEAQGRGCRRIFLTTHDFQAPGFYAKLGFQVVAEIPDKPLGHSEIVMCLSLNDAA